ncbi:endonuclease/exonuclease/phosphatase family protein [Leptobacterium sp. I13]|uniref:endonuclease/exonuclease/phosphatase family protein n=1 Tax=Leptobacterium meishanense TaxID=3128904 RepID=UPI0030ED1A48
MLLLLSYALPYVFPKRFPALSVLSLTVPILIIINFFFLIYWLLGLKKQFLLSLIILLIGYSHILAFYKFSGKEIAILPEVTTVMSYNVRLFNAYDWSDDKQIDTKIQALIKKENPDIICLQEFYFTYENAFGEYPYKYVRYRAKSQRTGQAIFSKHPIVNEGSLEFPDTGNNAIFIDVVKGKDTIRIYNLHLESLHISIERQDLERSDSEKLFKRMGNAFALQQAQAEIFIKHQRKNHYRKVVCGDFNNTQFSNIYRQVKGDMKDSFDEAGSGFGRTLNFEYFPMRIDFILVDEPIEVIAHKTFSEKYSDHYPIKASLVF